nr:phenylalanine--tRNA ligase subunit alpha [Actinomycetota bacterium]
MTYDLPTLLEHAQARIGAATSLADLDALDTDLLGKRSPLVAAKAALGGLEPDARREAGRALNEVRQVVQ